jgi:hypothetical protein
MKFLKSPLVFAALSVAFVTLARPSQTWAQG